MEDKQLHLLQVQYNGITLNNQDIDLMLIAGANNIYELKVALSKITNIKYPIEEMNLTESEFIVLRQRVYDLYLETLTSRPEYIMNKGIELKRKVDYLKASGILSNDEINIVNEILSQSKSKEEIVQRLNCIIPRLTDFDRAQEGIFLHCPLAGSTLSERIFGFFTTSLTRRFVRQTGFTFCAIEYRTTSFRIVICFQTIVKTVME